MPAASAATTDRTLFQRYAERAVAGTAVYTVDPAASKVRLYAFRGGKAARMGHNHVFDAPRFEGYLSLPGDDPTQAQFELAFRLDELTVDAPALRAETGGNFSGERSESDIAGTLRNLLSARVMDAANHPLVTLRSVRIEGDWPLLVARVAVTMHGTTREQDVLLQVAREAGALRVRGEFVLRQSDYGIVPLSILGGQVAVQDPVAVRFDLAAEPLSPQ